ncbi:hypothetical protein DU508_16550 [Pedobacter chinensis]|uniref:Uncharacterized protein n=1 Tax=Pedobacter chinensis TaxID=2282421 RepID=A0A369PYU3_9SPHI|nr:hypothetical protein DU508_16550 [Pedobacter chinensis]
MSNTLNIGSKIVTLRKARDWSQVDLAQQIGASRESGGQLRHRDGHRDAKAHTGGGQTAPGGQENGLRIPRYLRGQEQD